MDYTRQPFLRLYGMAATLALLCQSGYVGGMNAITFDTYKFVKRLTDAGMPEAQARNSGR